MSLRAHALCGHGNALLVIALCAGLSLGACSNGGSGNQSAIDTSGFGGGGGGLPSGDTGGGGGGGGNTDTGGGGGNTDTVADVSGGGDDATVTDTISPDTTADTSVPDASVSDTGAPDTAVDAGPADTGKPIGKSCGKPSDCSGLKETPVCAILDGYCVQCLVDTHCGEGETCKDYSCASIACVPGTKECQGNFLATCQADGKSWEQSTCPDGAPYCIGAECRVCQPNQTFCAPAAAGKPSKAVLKCNTTGSDAEFVLSCGGATSCIDGKCQICTPGLKQCDGGKAVTCQDDGSGWLVLDDCNAKDLACLGGLCVDPCGADYKSNTNVGCDYWAVDLDNAQVPCGPKLCDAQNMQYSVIISNTRPKAATVTVTTSTGKSSAYTIPPNALKVLDLPDPAWGLPGPIQVDGTGISAAAYRIKSNVPIVAYQFNPLQNVGVFSNDASLLLPANGVGNEYYVMSRQQNFNNLRGTMTVVAVSEGSTQVTVVTTAKTLPGKGVPGLAKGEAFKATLSQGEVLNIETNELGADLTGSRVIADKPIAVFGGSEGSNVPDTNVCVIPPGATEGSCATQGWPCTTNADCPVTCCADHIEEQLIPVKQWGMVYLASKLQPRGAEKDVWRILAAEDGTTVVTDPPQAAIPPLNKGNFFEFESASDFVILANKPIMVGQFMASANAPDPKNDTCTAKFSGSKVCEHYFTALGEPVMCSKNADCPNIKEETDAKTGDPAFILAVATDRFLEKYVVLVPDKYKANYINIVGPKGAAILLDGQPVAASGFSIFGSGAWKATRIAVQPGTHTIESSEAVGVVVYGYDDFVSYGFPGGMKIQ